MAHRFDDADVTIETTTIISIAGRKFTTGVERVAGKDCIRLKPHDTSLIKTVFSLGSGGRKISAAEWKKHPTLSSLPGFQHLLMCRNQSQAESLIAQPTRPKLFGKAKAKPKRLRNRGTFPSRASQPEPSLLDVPVRDGAFHISMQRPIKASDNLVVELEVANLAKTFTVLVGDGIDIADIIEVKRKYQAKDDESEHGGFSPAPEGDLSEYDYSSRSDIEVGESGEAPLLMELAHAEASE